MIRSLLGYHLALILGTGFFISTQPAKCASADERDISHTIILKRFFTVFEMPELSDYKKIGDIVGVNILKGSDVETRDLTGDVSGIRAVFKILPDTNGIYLASTDSSNGTFRPAGKDFARISYVFKINKEKICVRYAQVREVFGPLEKTFSYDEPNFLWYREDALAENMKYIGFEFDNLDCLIEVGISQNVKRKK